MKSLKSLDVPDLVKTVKSKRLPKEALRSVLPRFKLEEENLEMVESSETLKEKALKEYETYNSSNENFTKIIKEYTDYFN